jgi:hypothetical protein
MNRRSINLVKQKRKEGMPPRSSILKRKRNSCSQPTAAAAAPTPAPAARQYIYLKHCQNFMTIFHKELISIQQIKEKLPITLKKSLN